MANTEALRRFKQLIERPELAEVQLQVIVRGIVKIPDEDKFFILSIGDVFSLTTMSAGKKGGRRVVETHGKDFLMANLKHGARPAAEMKELGSRGGRATVRKYGKNALKRIQSKGGQTTRDRYGPDHFKQLGKMGAEAAARKRRMQIKKDGE